MKNRKESFFLSRDRLLSPFFSSFINNLIKNGNKDRAVIFFHTLLFLLKETDCSLNKKIDTNNYYSDNLFCNPLNFNDHTLLFNKIIQRCQFFLEFKKVVKGSMVEETVQLIDDFRSLKMACKFLIKNTKDLARNEAFLVKLYGEVSDILKGFGLSVLRKKDFYKLVYKRRAILTNIRRRKRRRKKINKI